MIVNHGNGYATVVAKQAALRQFAFGYVPVKGK